VSDEHQIDPLREEVRYAGHCQPHPAQQTASVVVADNSSVAAGEWNERFRQMAEVAPVFIWMAGPDKGCIYFNQRWLDFTGHALEEEIGHGWAHGVHPNDRARCLATYDKAFDHREEFTMEYRIRRHDGQYRWVLDTGTPVCGADGTLAGFVGACVDVTAQKEARDALRQSQQDLARMGRRASLGELSGSLAHELNQPLGAILTNAGAAQRLLSHPDPDLDELREILADIIEADRRARDLITHLRDLLEKTEPGLRAVELNAVVQNAIDLVKGEVEIQETDVSADLARSLPLVLGEAVQLEQVILNLMLNALAAMRDVPAGARHLAISTARHDTQSIRVTVRDCGSGVREEDLTRIFKSFYTTKPGGLGMGLAISRLIVQTHGGRLWAENNDDHGASFHFILPAVGEAGTETLDADRG